MLPGSLPGAQMCRGLWVCGKCLGPLCPSLSTRARNTCTNSKLAPPSLAPGPYQPPSPGFRPPKPDSTNLRGEGLAVRDRQRRWGLPMRSHREPSLLDQASAVSTICPTSLEGDCLFLFHHNAARLLSPRFLEELA